MGCISRGRLSTLAKRALRGAGASIAPDEKGLTEYPEDLFLPQESGIRSHLGGCAVCQKAFYEEFENMKTFLQHYNDILENTVVDERFDVISRLSLPSSTGSEVPGHEDIVLLYEPYLQPFEEASYLAAATDEAPEEDLRFCSRDGRYLLREYPDSTPGKNILYLIGEKGLETNGIEVVIDGKSFTTCEKGLLDISTEQLDLSSDSRVIIKGALRI
jgi:hypothetical protein